MLRPWKTTFSVPFDENSPTPLYLQIEKYLISEIRSGRFPENMILPSYREIAVENRVSETTVRTAFRRLRQRKWIRSEPRKGNFICYREEFREEIETNRSKRQERGQQEWQYRLDESAPLPQAVEIRTFARLFKQVLLRGGERPLLPRIANEHSIYDRLESIAIELLNQQYGFHLSSSGLCLIPGHQHILTKVAFRLLSGQMVIVTCPGNLTANNILQEVGALTVPLQVHPSGIDIIQLEALCKTHPIKAFLVDTASYTMMAGGMDEVMMDKIIAIAEKYRFLIIEHNSDRELWFGQSHYPLITSRRHKDRVIYLGYLSSLITPLNYFGIVTGPTHFISVFKQKWLQTSLDESQEIAGTVYQMLMTGEARQTLRKLRKNFSEKRDWISLLIRNYLEDHVTFTMPPAGLACWLYLKNGSDIGPLTDQLKNQRILLHPQADYTTGYKAYPAFFFGFARMPVVQIEKALQDLERLFKSLHKQKN